MIDPELLAKLQRRRGDVDKKGAEWETSPETSNADAKATEWIISEAAGAAAPAPARHAPAQTAPAAATSASGAGPTLAADAAAPAEAGAAEKAVKAVEAEKEDVPDEAFLHSLLAELKKLGRTPEGRQLLLSQTPVVRRALGELLKAQQAAQPAAVCGSIASAAVPSAEKLKERSDFAAECAERWPRLLAGPAAAEGAAKPPVPAAELAAVSEADVRTMRADVERTRRGDAAFEEGHMQKRLEGLLVGFCREETVHYTQGLHEVAAVFAFVQSVAPAGMMSESAALSCMTAFIHRFVPYFHDDESFVTLHISLLFFRQLLLYHHPDLHNQLAEAGVSPFLYATPWFITLFAARTPLAVLLSLWDRYLTRNEDAFQPFLALAMLVYSKPTILSAGSDGMHTAVQRAGLSSMQQLDEVWTIAEALRAKTPRSFEKRMSRVLEAVKERRSAPQAQDRSWTEQVLGRVARERSFVMLPQEVVAHMLQGGGKGTGRHRFLLLDVRPAEEQAQESCPQALHFQPPCLRRLVDLGRGSQPRLERLAATLSMAVRDFLAGGGEASAGDGGGSTVGGEAGGSPSASGGDAASTAGEEAAVRREVFEALKEQASERWGDDWLSDSACMHLVLLGGAADSGEAGEHGEASGVVAPLYEALTEQLSLARVSVVLGGAASVLRVARSNGVEGTAASASRASQGDAADSGSAGADSLFGSAWSRLQAATGALPPREVASERLGGLLHSAAKGLKKSAAVVQEQAAGSAEVVRQSAAEGMSALGRLVERFDEPGGTSAGYPGSCASSPEKAAHGATAAAGGSPEKVPPAVERPTAAAEPEDEHLSSKE